VVVVRDPITGHNVDQTIKREGPTVLLTTSIKRLGAQMDTRLFSLEVLEDQERIRAALTMRADIEISGGVPEPSPELLAYQAWLQSQAPWDVIVPFARRLSDACGASVAGARILRDFERLLSLIKAVTILRHTHRVRQVIGERQRNRLIATLEDYAVVHELVGPVYVDTIGVPAEVRRAVDAVRAFDPMSRPDGVRRGEVAKLLNLQDMAAWRHIQVALDKGWLVNDEWRSGWPAKLKAGEPMPDYDGLPLPRDLVSDPPSPPLNPR
jgi:hypothetical protein